MTERLTAQRIHKTKTTSRKVAMVDRLYPLVERYVRTCEDPWLFPNYQNKKSHIGHAAYKKDWKKRLAMLGITKNVKPYSFRHSFLTGTLGEGANLYEIQDMVGHSDANITKRYYHGSLEKQRKAANKLPLARSYQSVDSLLKVFKEHIEEFHFEDDDRLSFEMKYSSGDIHVHVKKMT